MAYSNTTVVNTTSTAVNVFCTPSVSINALPTVCAGQVFTMAAMGGAMTYSWFGPGMFGITGATAATVPTVNTCYTLAANNGSCNGYASTCVTLTPVPTISVTGASSVCAGTTTTLTGNGGLTYTWSIGAMGTTVMVMPVGPVCYSVIGANSFGCMNMAVHCMTGQIVPIIVSQSNYSFCVGSSVTFTASGTGVVAYSWSPSGPTTSTYNVIPTANTMYTVNGVDASGCVGTSTAYVMMDTTCSDVWPGDANSDGVVGSTDVFEIGLAFSNTGTARTPTSNIYSSWYAGNWTGTVSSGKNKVHADCNGDGSVDFADTVAISNNFALTHSFKPSGSSSVNPDISIVVPGNFVYPGMWNKADIMAGSPGNPINQVYGMSFDVDFDNSLVEANEIYIVYTSSFLNASTQNVIFRKPDFSGGKIYAATVRTDVTNVSGQGKIGEFYFKLKAGLADNTQVNMGVSNPTRINVAGTTGTMSTAGTQALVSNNPVGIKLKTINDLVGVYPNPAKDKLTLQSTSQTTVSYEMFDVLGRKLNQGSFERQTQLDVSALHNGTYVLKFQNGTDTSFQKLIIEK
jgi:hypothetical protein